MDNSELSKGEVKDWDSPRKGSIAICSLGFLGLITSDGLEEVTYDNGQKSFAFTGIHIGMEHLGKKWSSRNPMVIGHIQELENWVNISFKSEKIKIIKEKGLELLEKRKHRRNKR